MGADSRVLYQALLTLAVAQKQAVERDDIDELVELMLKREQLLAEIEGNSELLRQRALRETLRRDPTVIETLRLIVETDKQVEHAILGRMASLRKELSEIRTGQRLLNTYKPGDERATRSVDIGG